MYVQYKDMYVTENYCTINLNRQQRSLIAKLRLGILPKNVELGRYSGTPRENRYCIHCKDMVQDEVHVLFYCHLYSQLRQELLRAGSEYCDGFYILSDVKKIGFLTSHKNAIRKTASFINEMICARQHRLCV